MILILCGSTEILSRPWRAPGRTARPVQPGIGVYLATGYNTEASRIAGWCGINSANSQVTAAEYNTFVQRAIMAWHDAFPDRPSYLLLAANADLYYNCVWVKSTPMPTTTPAWFAGIENLQPANIGLGHNGMTPDLPGYYAGRQQWVSVRIVGHG